jgi:hypothetical protein
LENFFNKMITFYVGEAGGTHSTYSPDLRVDIDEVAKISWHPRARFSAEILAAVCV